MRLKSLYFFLNLNVLFQANQSPGSGSQPLVLISPVSTPTLSPSTETNQESVFIDGGCESLTKLKSPVSANTSSDIEISKNVVESYNGFGTNEAISFDTGVNQALRMLEEQLSLDDDTINEIDSFSRQGAILYSTNCEVSAMDFANNGPSNCIVDGSDYTARDTSYGGVEDGLSSFVDVAGLVYHIIVIYDIYFFIEY